MSKSGIGKLFENFYSKLFEADTTAKRLFEGTGMKAQGRALVNMIGIVVKSLDNWSVFSSIVLKLAGRHQIYGVKQKSYDIFAEILSDTIAQLCDDMPDTNVSHVQTLWKKVICTLSDLIVQAYPIASLPFSIVSSRKLLSNGSWKKSAVQLGLDTINIFRTEETNKLRSSLPLSSVAEYHCVEDQSNVSAPYGVKICYGSDFEEATFSFATKAQSLQFFEEFQWRAMAAHRLAKYEMAEGSGEGEKKSVKLRFLNFRK
eukprot:TRINITY_DN4445_c0_g1_i24.p2 TRINITY_DN4445_c0_g1~~TRINITY_DN4445_c0_g1_i24.p2  ORF type:complete len:259 (+),score=63.96 TRINITY_DN4445_c0_g1_i24:1481-2257(+)